MIDATTIANHLYQHINVYGDQYIMEQEIAGETFYLFFSRYSGAFYYTHPKWSMVGIGFSPLDAELDLIQDGKEMYEELRNDSFSDLTLEAIRMRDWCMQVHPFKIRKRIAN